MSDHAVQRSNSDEDSKLMSNTNIRESCLPYHSRWMAHWMQTCSSSSSQGRKCHVVSNESNKDHTEEQVYLPFESMKSREAEVLSMNTNTLQRSDPGELNLASGILQSAEVVGVEKDCNIISNSVVKKNTSLLDSEAVSSRKFSLQKLPDPSTDRKLFTTFNFLDPENVRSELEHFPMFDINRKIGTMSVRMSEPELTLSESEEHQLEARSISRTSDQEMRPPHESINGFLPYRDDLRGSSHSEIHKFKSHRSNMRSCMCTFSSALVHREHSACNNLNRELCNCSSRSFMVSEIKNGNDTIAKSFRSSLPKLKDGSMQVLRDSFSGDTSKIGLQKSSNSTHIFFRKNTGIDSSHGDQSIRESTTSAEIDETVSFEMPALPTMSHCHGQPPVSSRNGDDGEDGVGIDTHSKCLRHNPLDSLALSTKRLRTGDAPYSGEAQNLCSRKLDFDKSKFELSKPLVEQQEFGNTAPSTKNGDQKAMHCWIRRWCRGDQNLCEVENWKVVNGYFEGRRLPAMALMGKATKNCRPCEFRREGSSMVWNIK